MKLPNWPSVIQCDLLTRDYTRLYKYLMTQTHDRNQRLFDFAVKHAKPDVSANEFKDIVEAMDDNWDTDLQLLDRETERLYEVLPSIWDEEGM